VLFHCTLPTLLQQHILAGEPRASRVTSWQPTWFHFSHNHPSRRGVAKFRLSSYGLLHIEEGGDAGRCDDLILAAQKQSRHTWPSPRVRAAPVSVRRSDRLSWNAADLSVFSACCSLLTASIILYPTWPRLFMRAQEGNSAALTPSVAQIQ
jgi:hypothetical protein